MGCSPTIDFTNLTTSNTITVLPDVVGIDVSMTVDKNNSITDSVRSWYPSF